MESAKSGVGYSLASRRIRLIAFVVGLFMMSATALNLNAAPSAPLPTDAVFAPSSFWYTPIPPDVPLHSKSPEMVAEFLWQLKTYYGHVAVNTAAYASPVFTVDRDVPRVRVTQWDCQKKGRLDKGLMTQWADVPIPPYAEPSRGTDGEMTIYQPATDTIWEFWKARKVDGEWQACWGGRMSNASQRDGTWPGFYGTTATGLPFLGGQITAEELRRGEIRHAIGIALVHSEHWRLKSWPAQRSDGSNRHKRAHAIPQGLRFRLDPTLDVDALKMHPIAKTIATAAQRYGFVVWDGAGAISIRLQNPVSYTALGQPNPYPELFAGARSYEILRNFPWERLQFLPQDYGRR